MKAFKMIDLIARYNKLIGKKQALQSSAEKLGFDIDELSNRNSDMVKAKELINEVSKNIQKNICNFIEPLVDSFLHEVYKRKFSFELKCETKRDRVEVTPIIKNEYGTELSLQNDDDIGGSVVDLVSFAIRMSLMSIEKPRKRMVFIADEPFRCLGRYAERIGILLKEISQKTGIQLLIITHNENLSENAERSWRVSHNGINSVVTEI